jgi:WhiB family redox-sensing transcriptional regulator
MNSTTTHRVPVDAPPGINHQHKALTKGRDKEVSTMALTELIDAIAPTEGEDLIPCRENDAEIWFAELPQDVEFAKALCRTCPAVAQCLAGALDRREPWGVWGGELFVAGQIVARKRPRGRPRKNPVAA